MPALKNSRMLAEISAHPDRYPVSYLAHEYLGASWQPLWVSEVRHEMAPIGLSPVGSATLHDNYDSWSVGQQARETLDAIDDDLRELTRDCFMDQSFRRDVYVRDGQSLTDEQRQERLLQSCFALCQPPGQTEYAMAAPAGRVSFDNPAARAIVNALASGPATLAEIRQRSATATQDMLANGLVLAASGALRPVGATQHSVVAVNTAMNRRLTGVEDATYLALSCGTALRVEPDLLRAFAASDTSEMQRFPGWREFLSAYCR